MNGITPSEHFCLRFQQRGMDDIVVMALLHYGQSRASRHGIDSLMFTKDVLIEIRNDCGPTVAKMCERQRNTYLIVSDDGVLITVAHGHRKTIH